MRLSPASTLGEKVITIGSENVSVTIINLKGGREVSSQNSENYKKKIIEFMEADGNFLLKDSSSHGITADLVFEEPLTGKKILVEAKYTSLSRLNDGFIKELGRYFLEYMDCHPNKRSDFYIFVRELKAYEKWRHIFETSVRKEREVREIYERVLDSELRDSEKSNLEKYDFEDFMEFVGDTYVHHATYDQLSMKIDEFNEDDKFKTDFYHIEREPLKEEETVVLNTLEIDKFPDKIYGVKLKNSSTDKKARKDIDGSYPAHFHNGKAFLIENTPPEELSEHLVEDSWYAIDFLEAINNNRGHRKAGKDLINRAISYLFKQNDFLVEHYQGDFHHYVRHNTDDEETKRNNLQFARYFDEANPPFVRHESVVFNMQDFDESLAIMLKPEMVFTSDGETLIKGKEAKDLHDKFSTNRYGNNYAVKRNLRKWSEILHDSLEKGRFNLALSEPMKTKMRVRPPKDPDERDTNMNSRGLKQYE